MQGKLFSNECSLKSLNLSLRDRVEGSDGVNSEDLDGIFEIVGNLFGVRLVALSSVAIWVELNGGKFVYKCFKLLQFGTCIIIS